MLGGLNGEGSLPPAPFIVGVGRSGTTLFRLMLDSHPDLAIPPEANFLVRLIRNSEVSPVSKDWFMGALMDSSKWRDFHVETQLLRKRIAELNPFTMSDAVRTVYKLYAERFGKARWGDKSTKSIAHMSVIQRLLSEARFIHVIRDGRDVALSRNKWLSKKTSIQEAAERWVSKIRKARRQARELNYYLEVRYEDLVLHTETTLKDVCHFVDLSWDPAMLYYYKESKKRLDEFQDCTKGDGTFRKAEERRRKHDLTSEPPQRDRVGCWKKEMSSVDRERFENIAATTLDDLGYEISTNLRPASLIAKA